MVKRGEIQWGLELLDLLIKNEAKIQFKIQILSYIVLNVCFFTLHFFTLNNCSKKDYFSNNQIYKSQNDWSPCFQYPPLIGTIK